MNDFGAISVDLKFVSFVGVRLPLFHQKKNNLYQCRCPICGDSKRDKTKTRGYFYEYKGGMQYKCHNCNISLSLNNFLKQVAPDLHKEYAFERFGFDNDRKKIVKKLMDSNTPSKPFDSPKPVKFYDNAFLKSAKKLIDLPDDHPALVYIRKRQIPEQFVKQFFYVEEFKKFSNEVVPYSFEDTKNDEPRIIIPFYNENKQCFAFQGRSLKKDSKVKYISIKRDPDEPLIWGMDRIDKNKKVYVVEGPIDAMFLPNAIAAAGASLGKFDDSKLDVVYVFDAEPRNAAILKSIKKIIQNKKRVCIWPDSVKFKDINDMILNGLTIDRIVSMINTNTYSGAQAILKLGFWAKVPF